MTFAWDQFTPWHALAGGALIGLSAALLMLGSGRIAGIATMLSGPLHAVLGRTPMSTERARLLFVAGLIAAPWVWRLAAPLPTMTIDVGRGTLALAGLLVGMGVCLGNGCTSGHGVCGLSRGSRRSLVNVGCFMAAAALTVFVVRHVR